MDDHEYREVLARCGGLQAEIPFKERWRVMQEWRAVYAAPFHQQTGRWKDGQFEWHLFSGRHVRALSGAKGSAAYEAERPTALVIVPEAEELPALRIDLPRGKSGLPDFGAIYGDVYLWPPDLCWTMAFTHEQESGLGPYFSRREWVMI